MTEMAQLLAQMQAAQAVLEDQSRRIEAAMNAQDDRLATLESAAGQRIRGLEAAVADLSDTLSLAGETITVVIDLCRRHGYDESSGLSVLAWLEYVLDWAAAGWPSAN